MATLSSIPPELLIKILHHSLTTALQTPPVLVHGQFTTLSTTCRTCAYRNIAGVCKTWRAIAQEIMGRDVTLANGCGSAEKDEQVVQILEKYPHRANNVRLIDASLRRAMCSWSAWAVPGADGAGYDDSGSSSSDAANMISTRQAQAERWHEQCLARERQRFVRLLKHCRRIEELDVDVGFFQDLRMQPSLLPPSIRTLTLRNCDAADTFTLLPHLPHLESLTLRLALDWFLPPLVHIDPSSLPSLARFELSTTAFGSTSLPSILALLSNSHSSLRALTLRNKGASKPTVEAFLPVASGLVEVFAGQLVELTIKDIPRCGIRVPSTGALTGWLPSRPTHLPRLQHLHLTGLPLPDVATFTRSLVLSDPSAAAPDSAKSTGGPTLDSLTIEDFDAVSLAPLLHALRSLPALSSLSLLRLAFAREGEMRRRGEGDWEGASAEWCGERGTKLLAGWGMVKIEGCGWW
ncbi:uncharacterized protein JCM10292_006604 [Rhodotorula paludigena]|uniref:uncharacterized protein n=1 Tax=Rhodotorula paludigena TaxID=86838 RepID=UPI0031719395